MGLSLSPEVEAPPSCTTEEESWEEGRLIYPNAVGTTERGVSSPANPDRVVWVPMSITIAETSSAFCVFCFVVVVGVVCGVIELLSCDRDDILYGVGIRGDGWFR
jgi:hypothetical protein